MEDTKKKIIELLGRENLTVPCTHKLMHDENDCPFGQDSHLMPFSLAVVLRAIYRLDLTRTDGTTYYLRLKIDLNGDFMLQDGPFGEWSRRGNWNLERDSWDEQSKETRAFVGSLLVAF